MYRPGTQLTPVRRHGSHIGRACPSRFRGYGHGTRVSGQESGKTKSPHPNPSPSGEGLEEKTTPVVPWQHATRVRARNPWPPGECSLWLREVPTLPMVPPWQGGAEDRTAITGAMPTLAWACGSRGKGKAEPSLRCIGRGLRSHPFGDMGHTSVEQAHPASRLWAWHTGSLMS